MKTHEVIESILNDAVTREPVDRVRSPALRLAGWALFSTAVIVTGLSIYGVRPDLASVMRDNAFLLQSLVIVVFTLLSAYGAFVLSVPGSEEIRTLRVLPVLAGFVLLGLALYSDLPNVKPGYDVIWGGQCSIVIVGVGAVPGLLLFWIASRSAPLRVGWVGALAAMGSAGAICAGMQFICHDKPPLHFLIWHLLPVAISGFVGIRLGHRAFRWWNQRAGVP